MQPALPVQATSPARMELALGRQARAPRCGFSAATLSSGTPEISRFCHTVSRISPSPSSCAIDCQAAHLFDGHAPDRQYHADPVQARLLLRMDADMGRAIEGPARRTRFGGTRSSLRPSFSSFCDETLSSPDPVEDVFEARLVAVGAVALVDEYAHHRVRHLGGVRRAARYVGLAREIPMALMSPSARRNQTPGSTPKPSITSTAWKPMSFVSSSTGIVPAPSKATLNLRGKPKSARSLRMWKCDSRA